jgi:CheY-like chemotaxis protein
VNRSRPPPKVLLVHNGVAVDGYVKHLTDAGLRVADARVETAVADALHFQPDIIVLDFSANGEITAQLKQHDTTKHIPIIALADLSIDKRSAP